MHRRLSNTFPKRKTSGKVPSRDVDQSIKDAVRVQFHFHAGRQIANQFVFDVTSVKPSKLKPKAIIKDCELIMEIVKEYPEELQCLIEAVQRGYLLEATSIIRRMGFNRELTEERSGGLLNLLAAVGTIALFSWTATASVVEGEEKNERDSTAEERFRNMLFDGEKDEDPIFPGGFVGSIIGDCTLPNPDDVYVDWGKRSQGNQVIGQKLRQIIELHSDDNSNSAFGNPPDQSFGQEITSNVTVSIPSAVIDTLGDLNDPQILKGLSMRLSNLAQTMSAASTYIGEEELARFARHFFQSVDRSLLCREAEL